jgi:hypothetical protein
MRPHPSLPDPPPSPADLADFPCGTPEFGWRVFRRSHQPIFYFRGPSRFVPITPDGIGVLYTADSLETAISEVFSFSPIALDDVRCRGLAKIALTNLRLADTSAPAATQWGLTPEISLAPDEGPSQRWASAFVEADFDGVIYSSRHASGGRLIALFGPVGTTLARGEIVETTFLREEQVEAAGIRVMPIP